MYVNEITLDLNQKGEESQIMVIMALGCADEVMAPANNI